MKRIRIRGNRPLSGEITVSGGKNAALPVISASLLSEEKVVLENVPDITDVCNSCQIIRKLGANAEFENNILIIDPQNINSWDIPCEEAAKMRSSVLFAGALLARYKKVFLPKTGGCNLGKRPIDIHISAFEKMGAKAVKTKKGIILESDNLKGAEIELKKQSVGATENIMIAASLAEGRTIIKNAALEPEVMGLADFLNMMGAKIDFVYNNIIIEGVERLKGGIYRIIPDRIEAGTYLCAAAVSGGSIIVKNADINHLRAITDILARCGCILTYSDNGDIAVFSDKNLIGGMNIVTAPYPDFPTDMQAQIMAVLSVAEGSSTVEEKIFSSRLGHISELNKMGADIKIMTKRKFYISGSAKLKGANVASTDLRAGAALIIAALSAKGETIIDNAHYIFRGYENISEKLKAIGADIEYI